VVTDTRVAVVGVGRLGACLVRALHGAGVQVTGLADDKTIHAQQLAEALGLHDVVRAPARVAERAEVVFLAVPDSAIANVATTLEVSADQAVAHTSGAFDVTPLMAAQRRGAATGVFHPLQAFSPGASADRFTGIAVGVDAEPPLFERLARLAQRLGASSFALRGVDRARYHAAAVFASNYLVALHVAAARVWQEAGLPVDAARPALVALSRGALESMTAYDFARALTGPVARGDAATVARHLQALGADPDSHALYRALGRELMRLPLDLTPQVRAELEALLRP
jgi:predicted short-subunit dehydrogenase-like oxidoreductase (DUF2520 family)